MNKEQIKNITPEERSSLDQKRTATEKSLNDGGAEYLYDANQSGERLSYVTTDQIEGARTLMQAEKQLEKLKKEGIDKMSADDLMELGKLLINMGEEKKVGIENLHEDVTLSQQEDKDALVKLRRGNNS